MSAPVAEWSGTVRGQGSGAIISTIGAGVCLAAGNFDRALLFLILGTVMLIGRKEDVK